MAKSWPGRESVTPGSSSPILRAVDRSLAAIPAGHDRMRLMDESALIHSGTSTALAIGSPRSFPPGEEGWVIGTGGEWREAVGFGTVRIRNEALSGSSKRLKGEHILDPRTGYPAREHLAAWSLAPSAAVADALSTAFMVMSTAEVMELCKSMAAVGGLVIVPRQGILGAFSDEAIATPEFRARAVKIAATDS